MFTHQIMIIVRFRIAFVYERVSETRGQAAKPIPGTSVPFLRRNLDLGYAAVSFNFIEFISIGYRA